MSQQTNHHWFRLWLVAWPAPSHYLHKCWNIVNWTIRNKPQWNLKRNSYIFTIENAFENVVWKMAAILSRRQCVNSGPGPCKHTQHYGYEVRVKHVQLHRRLKSFRRPPRPVSATLNFTKKPLLPVHEAGRICTDLAPVPLTVSIFRSNSKFDENSERSSFEYTWPITTIFCTRHVNFTLECF